MQVCILYHIRVLKLIRSSLSSDVARTVASALVNSRFDYANSVLYGTSVANISRQQCVQNALARVVTYTKRAELIRPILYNLHWLPNNSCIEYKVAKLAFKYGQQAIHLLPAVSYYIVSRHLRSSSQLLLSKPAVRTETT